MSKRKTRRSLNPPKKAEAFIYYKQAKYHNSWMDLQKRVLSRVSAKTK